MNDILTPAQIALFSDPRIAQLRKRFDLQPIQSKEVKFNNLVTQQIENWFSQFSNPNHIEPIKMIKYKSSITGQTHESPF